MMIERRWCRKAEEAVETNGEVDVGQFDQAAAWAARRSALEPGEREFAGLALAEFMRLRTTSRFGARRFSSRASRSKVPVKAAQGDADGMVRLVAEVPALGFSWIPRSELRSLTLPARKDYKLADSNVVRNEFFEAEIDKETGGLRAFRDLKRAKTASASNSCFSPAA